MMTTPDRFSPRRAIAYPGLSAESKQTRASRLASVFDQEALTNRTVLTVSTVTGFSDRPQGTPRSGVTEGNREET